jgi:protein gp37
MNNVKKTIGWADYTINPVKGLCPVGCSYCYARRMYKRFHLRKDGTVNPAWDYTIRHADLSIWDELDKMKAGSKVFVGSTMELFGPWVTPLMRSNIFHVCELYPDLTFIFLTKRPQDLPHAFGDNCWVGVSVCDDAMFASATNYLEDIQAKVKFMSFEPLLGHLLDIDYAFYYTGINWLIVGQQTPASAKTTPQVEWVQEIVEAADKAEIPVFLKNNLRELFFTEEMNTPLWALKDGSATLLRQKFPEVKS